MSPPWDSILFAMGLLLPNNGFPGCPVPVADPWEKERSERRERVLTLLTGRLHGEGAVCSDARAVWIPMGFRHCDPLEDLAFRLDVAAERLVKGRGALDLAIGEALEELFAGGGLEVLRWSRQVDFAREGLGIPPRTMYAFLELARAVKDLPELRLAVVRGDISALKAKAIAPAIRKEPDRQAFLLHVASTRTLPDIQQILRDLGAEVPKEPFEVRTRRFRMAAEMQDHLDRAIELAKSVVGYGKPRYVYEEAIAMEFLSAHPELVPEPPDEKPPAPPPGSVPPTPADRKRLFAEWESRDTREIAAALDFLLSDARHLIDGNPVRTDDPVELEALLQKFLSFRKRQDEPLGRILETISTLRLFTFLGYSSFARYSEDRLGIAERVARQRVWLERRMVKLPSLRMAMLTGRLTYSKALLVARDATAEDVGRRIREAAETTWQQTERQSTEKEDRRNLAAGVRKIWGPAEAMETIEAAISAAKRVFFRKTGLRIGDGEAFGIVAAGFVDEWGDAARRKRLSPLKRKVFERTKGICATPGCGNPAEHMHHIIYRSNEGPDEEWNCCYLCFRCHRKIHKGRMQVMGRAGERLQWRFWRGRGRWERWETIGADDVRRIGETPPMPSRWR